MHATALAPSRGSRRTQGPLATLAIMVVTGVVIAVVAFLVNQPSAAAGVTAVTLTGDQSGAAPVPGQPAPDFAVTTVDGKKVQLSAFRGQPVWLTFGASWCQPCRAENPDIEAAYQKYAAQGLVVLAIYISEDGNAVTDYASRVGLTYLKAADPDTRIASEYRILGIPSHFFVDRTGTLHAIRVGTLDPASMDAALGDIIG